MRHFNCFSSSDFAVRSNLTTYDYIVNQRELAETAARQNETGDMENVSSTAAHRGKVRGGRTAFYHFVLLFQNCLNSKFF